MATVIDIKDLRGGMNTNDEPQSIPDDQVVDARNIDWSQGTLGGKRPGCEQLTIDASVLSRVIPAIVNTTAGSITAASVLNIVVPAATDDGTGVTYRYLVVKVVSKAVGTAINAITYNGSPMTGIGSGGTALAGRVEAYYFPSAPLAGGTVAITFAANVDATAVAELWGRVDQIDGALGTNGTSTAPLTVRTTTPIYVVGGHIGYETTVTAAPVVTGTTATATDQTSGTVRMTAHYVLGRSPQISQTYVLSGSVEWVQLLFRLRGAPISAYSTTGFTILALIRHTPTNNITEDELWMVDNFGRIDRRVGGTWQGGVPGVNGYIGVFDATDLDINGASLHGKFFLAAHNSIGALMVWDGTALRHAGFPNTPPVPTVADTAVAGSYTGTRYFRVRFVEQASGVTIRRSEPSTAVTFTPAGAFNGAIITKPSGTEEFYSQYMNGQTHWEVEASLDNLLFYRIATVAVATTTYTDTTVFGTGYSSNTLSDSIGEYTSPPSARHVAVDDDRLMMAGNRTTASLDSRVMWTPVANSTGVGNDERIPLSTGNTIDLDNLDGGRLTMLVAGESGNVYAFKQERTYKLTRTGVLTAAYAPQTESRTRGALNRAACSGQDEAGSPSVYFADPSVGLCRANKRGIEMLGEDVLDMWEDAHKGSTSLRGPKVAYWPFKRQVFLIFGADGSTVPDKILVFNARFGTEGTKGWSLYESDLFDTGLYSGMIMFPDNGLPLLPIISSLNPSLLKFTTTAVNDAGTRYRAYWRSRAFLANGMFGKFGTMAGILFARAAAATTIGIGLIRNLGVARRDVTISIAPAGSETHVFKPVDNAFMSECFALQFELGDPTSYTGAQLDQTWSLNAYVAKIRQEEEGTS